MKSRFLLLVLFCVALCSGVQAGEKVFHVEPYWPPKDRTKWNTSLTAIMGDIEKANIRGTSSIERQKETMRIIFAENGFKGPKGTLIILLPEMGYFVVRSDKVFHRKLTRGLGLQVKPE